jgi:hypothetical protein
MGFARRVVRRSARRAVRRTVSKPVRKAVRTATPRPVRQAMHPAYTVRNAVTPLPVKRVSYAAHTVRHPFLSAWDAIIGAVLYSPRIRRRKREVSRMQPARQPTPPAPAPVRQTAPRAARTAPRQSVPPQRTTPPLKPDPMVMQMARWNNGPGGLAFRALRTDANDLSSLLHQAAAAPGERTDPVAVAFGDHSLRC